MTKAERRVGGVDGYKVLHSMLKGEYTEESNGARTIRQSGGKDRHSKVFTSRGARDRRVRLSVATAIRFYDLQDRLGFDQPSKAVEWLLLNSQPAIQCLPQLGLHHIHPHQPPPNPPPNTPLNHPLITNILANHAQLDGVIDGAQAHDYHIINGHAINHAINHAQICEGQTHPIINHTSWPTNPTTNPPQTSLEEEDPQYSNYSSASSDARLSSSSQNPAFQHNKRKRTQNSTNNHHQFSIIDLQDDYACSSNFKSQPYLPAERLTIFNESPMNYCPTNGCNENNIPSDNNWISTQDQLNAHTHLQFPNNAIQSYKTSFANHAGDNTRLVFNPNLASHLIPQHVNEALAQSMEMLTSQCQLDEIEYEFPSPSESTSIKASKGIQASNLATSWNQKYGGRECIL